MTETPLLTYEQAQAWKLLELTTIRATEDAAKRSAWLLTAVGAALTFVVANSASIASLISLQSFRISLLALVFSMLCGLAAQTLTSRANNALALGRIMLEMASTNHDHIAFRDFFLGGLSRPIRKLALHKAERPNPAGFMALIYTPAKVSQRQSIWCFFQLAFAIAAVFLLAVGVKV